MQQYTLIHELLPARAPFMVDTVEKALSKALVSSLGASVAELGELVADKIRYLRWTSAVQILEKAKEFSEPYGGLRQVPPLKFFLPFMENCSLEEGDSELVDMWANLLVAAAQDFMPGHLLFMRILREITGDEARLLRTICHSDGSSIVPQSSLIDAQLRWDMFSAPASPLRLIDIGMSWDKTQTFVFKEFQKPGIAIESLSLEIHKNDELYEIESIESSDTHFYDISYISLDILTSLNLIGKSEHTLIQQDHQLWGVAYFTTPVGAAFYIACSSNECTSVQSASLKPR